MPKIRNEINTTYGGKIRVRVMGILIQNDKLLLLNHQGLNEENIFWCPPGGGIDFGQSIEESLIREFKEECHITIKCSTLIDHHEHIAAPLHAIEFLYKVKSSMKPNLGSDPETDTQTINQLKWFSEKELREIPIEQLHPLLIKHISTLFSKSQLASQP